jgi:hypothetical protein
MILLSFFPQLFTLNSRLFFKLFSHPSPLLRRPLHSSSRLFSSTSYFSPFTLVSLSPPFVLALYTISPFLLSFPSLSPSIRSSGAGAAKLKKINAEFSSSSSSFSFTDDASDTKKGPPARGGYRTMSCLTCPVLSSLSSPRVPALPSNAVYSVYE